MTYFLFSLKQYITKALSITLILGLILSSLALNFKFSESLNTIIVQALTTSGNWTDTGNYSTDWYYNDPDADTYYIGTSAELAGLSYLVNSENDSKTFEDKTIILTNNINLEEHYWIPIGVGESISNSGALGSFKGTFDGQGYTINNMFIGKIEEETSDYESAGLFGWVEKAKIMNVNIGEGSYIYTDSLYTGGICGFANEETIISNCSNGGNIFSISSGSFSSAGGICGFAINVTITDCSNIGNISSKNMCGYSYAGGICGKAEVNSIISNCVNDGTTSAVTKDTTVILEEGNATAGGICGDIAETTILNSINTGSISSSSDDKGVVAISGGIAGKTSDITISNCSNSGIITAKAVEEEGLAIAGGICGESQKNSIINICSNNGNISSISQNASAAAGGICSKTDDITINNCVNSGSLTADAEEGALVGGICSIAYKTIVKNCINSGTVFSSSDTELSLVGGICGLISEDSEVNDTYYNHDIAEKGIGNQEEDQEGATALSEEELQQKVEELIMANKQVVV